MNRGLFGLSSQVGSERPSWSKVLVKRADNNLSSFTTLTLDPHLQIWLPAGTYSGQVTLLFSGSNTTHDVKLDMLPGTGVTAHLYRAQSAFNGVGVASSPTALLQASTVLTFGSIADFFGITLEYFLITTAQTLLGLRWAQNTSNASPLILNRGSRMEVYKG